MEKQFVVFNNGHLNNPMRTLETMLLYEAKQKPQIQALVERVYQLTDQEINDAEVPLPWFRTALRQMRDRRLLEDALNTHTRHDRVPDPEGNMKEWIGGEAWLDIGRGNQLLIRDGMLVWFPHTGGVWIESIFIARFDPRLVYQTRPAGRKTKSEYALARRAALLGQNPELAAMDAATERQPFRIYRL